VSPRLGLLLALLFGVLVAYLTAFNPSRVRIALTPSLSYDIPLIALVVGVFLAGAGLAIFVTLMRDLGRSYRDYQSARRARRDEGLADIYRRGAEAQLAGKPEIAAAAYRDLLSRDPDHPEAHLRLGEMAGAVGDHRAAVDHFLKALRSGERPEILLALAREYERAGQASEALAVYRRVLGQDREHRTALRAIRDLAVSGRRWTEALESQEALLRLASADERQSEQERLAGIHYEIGKGALAEGKIQEALSSFRESLKIERSFVPAYLAMGHAYEHSGDRREAIRSWERGAEIAPALPLLHALEQAHREEGRPTKMIALYREALSRAPQDLALAVALGRVLFELEMLDEAADHFQKIEVNAPDLPQLHAYLGAVFERRGQTREAFEEYRRALNLLQGFEWPHTCSACGARHSGWLDRCPSCGRWNSLRP
jgi:lipopolysaccharide biosynthesis regulator YciM